MDQRLVTWIPPLSLATLALGLVTHPAGLGLLPLAVVLALAVLAAVHHAEIVALRLGEPFGSLVLAVAVTVIEVALIVTLMLTGDEDTSTLARDTVFAAVMISVNGIVGLSLVISARRHHLAVFNAEGTGSALATVMTLATLTLVLPRFTTSHPGPEFTGSQLTFAAVASLALYGMFVFTQTVRHRDFFLPVSTAGEQGTNDEGEHVDPPSGRAALLSLGLLIASLVAVVGLAKLISPAIEAAVATVGLPHALVGVMIALLVLLPESISAARAAARQRVQTSLNLAYGSAMASIGLTIPTLAVASIWLEGPLRLGLGATEMVLLFASVIVGVLTVVPGRAKPLNGGLHLAIVAAFVFLTIAP